jgi:hypothetical protein
MIGIKERSMEICKTNLYVDQRPLFLFAELRIGPQVHHPYGKGSKNL